MTQKRTVVWLTMLLVLGNVGLGIYFMIRSGASSESKETERNSAFDERSAGQGRPAESAVGVAPSGAGQGTQTGTSVYSVRVPSFEERAVPEAVAAFRLWTQKFLAAKSTEVQPALVAEGEALARQRRQTMLELIQTNPQRALEFALAPNLRARLPASVQESVEEWVSGHGAFSVLIADDFERAKSQTFREVVLNDKHYRAYVYGRRLEQISRPNEPLQGVVLGDMMAVHEDPPPKERAP